MNFSDETVSKVARAILTCKEVDLASGVYWQQEPEEAFDAGVPLAKAALSSLTLADLMQVEEVRGIVEAAEQLSGFMKKYAGQGGAIEVSADNPFTANGYADRYILLDKALKPFLEAK